MRLFNKVAIVGVGLIGGSIGRAIKKRRLARRVIGISRHKQTINSAKRGCAIDQGFTDISGVRGADLVILAAPVGSIIEVGLRIIPLIKPQALVFDTGSTKQAIVRALEDKLPNFVGCHPLAGSQKQGVLNADANLFRDTLCIFTPTKRTPPAALKKARAFWKALGAKTVDMPPAMHDKYIAYVSHLVHIAAFSLIESIPARALCFAASGLKDTTRIAASGENLWKDIILTNPENILAALKDFNLALSKIRSAIISKDASALLRLLRQARLKREKLE